MNEEQLKVFIKFENKIENLIDRYSNDDIEILNVTDNISYYIMDFGDITAAHNGGTTGNNLIINVLKSTLKRITHFLATPILFVKIG